MMNNTTTTFAGNLAADPEVRFTPNGNAVAEFRVMVNRRTRDDEGNWQDAEPTGWTCKLWGTPAENLANRAHKGDRVLIHGHIETDAWNDKETGGKRTKPIVQVEEIGLSLAWNTAARSSS